MTQKRLTSKKRVTESNLENVPNQSGVYVLRRKSGSVYVGSATAGRLQKRVREQVGIKKGVTSFQYRATASAREARRLEGNYRDRLNPGQKI